MAGGKCGGGQICALLYLSPSSVTQGCDLHPQGAESKQQQHEVIDSSFTGACLA